MNAGGGRGASALAVGGLLAGASLAGLGGLGAEVVLLSGAGLAIGYGRAAALGLAVWVAAWALGARVASERAGRNPLLSGLAAAAATWGAGVAIAYGGRPQVGALTASLAGFGGLALAAFSHGWFLPVFARALATRSRRLGVPALYACNLAGAVAGARWIGFDAMAAFGRTRSVQLACLALVLAGGAAWLGRGSTRAPGPPRDRAGGNDSPVSIGALGWSVGCITALTLSAEWIALRQAVLWLGGMQVALSSVLAASLLALALGALVLPPLLPRGRSAGWVLAALTLAALLWPFVADRAILGVLGDVRPQKRPFATAILLAAPLLAPLGAWVPVLHRLGGGESGARLSRLFAHEAWGALIGVPLTHFLLLPVLGSGGALAASALWVPLALWPWSARAVRAASFAFAAAVAGFAATRPEPALASPALSNPAFERLEFREDEHFAVTVVHDGLRDERTLLTDDFRATATGDDYLYMRVLAHLPLLLHPDPRRVAVLAFGTGTTAGAVSLHSGVERIDVLELSEAVCELAPHFESVNHGVLSGEDERVHVLLGDGRRTLREHPGAFDVVTMEPLLPNSPFAVYLYTREFYELARRSVRPGGLVCQWVPPHALERETFEAVVESFASAFPWHGTFLFGTQVILVGAEREPLLDPTRFETSGELREALDELGLVEPAGVVARFVAASAPATRRRPLVDADPWIVFEPGEAGANQLRYLPDNLAWLRAREEPPPVAWLHAAPGAQACLAGVRELHHAREAWHRQRAERFGVVLDGPGPPDDLETYRERLAERIPGDPERLQFERAVSFALAREQGVRGAAGGERAWRGPSAPRCARPAPSECGSAPVPRAVPRGSRRLRARGRGRPPRARAVSARPGNPARGAGAVAGAAARDRARSRPCGAAPGERHGRWGIVRKANRKARPVPCSS